MKSRETLIRLKKFQVDEKRRKVAQIEAMIAEFDRIAGDLDREIKTEQDRAGIHDPAHFAYPTYAKAAIARRENLKRSADELKTQLDDAKASLGEAFEELKKVEMLDERDHAREKAEAERPRAGRTRPHRITEVQQQWRTSVIPSKLRSRPFPQTRGCGLTISSNSCLNRVGESEAFGMFMRSLRHAYKAGSMMFWPEPQPRPVRQKRRKQNPRVAPARRQQRRSRARSRAAR